MTNREIIYTTGIIIDRIIHIPLNGEPSRITFQLKLEEDQFRKYTTILKNFPEEFIMDCIGKKVPVTLQKISHNNGIINEYNIIEININDVELHDIESQAE